MSESWLALQRIAKRGLAAGLFLLLLLGGSAAALSILAAGISALSGVGATAAYPAAGLSTGTPTAAALPPAAQTQNSPSGNASATVNGAGVVPGASTAYAAGISRSNQFSNQLDQMHSPIGAAIDSGGVLLGNRVQSLFGSVLSGVLQALFLEQPDTSPVPGGNHG